MQIEASVCPSFALPFNAFQREFVSLFVSCTLIALLHHKSQEEEKVQKLFHLSSSHSSQVKEQRQKVSGEPKIVN